MIGNSCDKPGRYVPISSFFMLDTRKDTLDPATVEPRRRCVPHSVPRRLVIFFVRREEEVRAIGCTPQVLVDGHVPYTYPPVGRGCVIKRFGEILISLLKIVFVLFVVVVVVVVVSLLLVLATAAVGFRGARMARESPTLAHTIGVGVSRRRTSEHVPPCWPRVCDQTIRGKPYIPFVLFVVVVVVVSLLLVQRSRPRDSLAQRWHANLPHWHIQ